MYELIEQIEDEIVKCVRCGVCRIHCPTFVATNAESAVSRGKIYLVDAVLKGDQRLGCPGAGVGAIDVIIPG